MSLTGGLFLLGPEEIVDINDPRVEWLICRDLDDGSHIVLDRAFGFSEASYLLRRMAWPTLSDDRNPDEPHPVMEG